MKQPETTASTTAEAVQERMLRHDAFSQLLGLEVEQVGPGYCRLHFTVRPDMLNGFAVLHGGVAFAAADSAFAFACNSHGRQSVGLTVTIDYLEAGKLGDVITVEAREESLKHKVGVYQVRATNQHGVVLALFKGTAYRTSKAIL
ncbi:hydroxyphenylacetyl-CoA thioesterase PaaI [Hymenobacter sp. 5516J-16]|uniref:hydroxyphenylacetyl-CoA thioesterase PaaI n=1 Tax=Hymenobacter sp. 5516J-16 TaxID=2932253 RepID=UPI001FD498C0|nr:hydroxyphenylacetyl-CoA thioesterase PaaI [Hymenobacter sp. 5516J-16]UOQ77708.1 hydroxyphenylacetyl-CoA thioesterase PaaI [Hymenobacter sp. 5516J-16]